MKGTDMQTIHTKAGFKVLRESLGLYQSDVAEAAGVDVKTVKNWESPRLPRARADCRGMEVPRESGGNSRARGRVPGGEDCR